MIDKSLRCRDKIYPEWEADFMKDLTTRFMKNTSKINDIELIENK